MGLRVLEGTQGVAEEHMSAGGEMLQSRQWGLWDEVTPEQILV